MDRRWIDLNDQDLFTGTAPADYDAVRVGGKRSTTAGAARHAGGVDPGNVVTVLKCPGGEEGLPV